MMGARVKENPKAASSNHGAVTREQLAAKGLVAVETPGHGAIADVGIEHYSIRPSNNPDPNIKLTPQEMDYVKAQLESLTPHIQAKPKDVGCG